MRIYRSALCLSLGAALIATAANDSIPSGFSRPLNWRVGVEAAGAFVPGTNDFLRGDNPERKNVSASLSGAVRADFTFGHGTKERLVYKDVYQGVALGAESYFANSLLGTPVEAYVYQGAPIMRLGSRLNLAYEWRFGAALGWKHYEKGMSDDNEVIGTSTTAMMGVGLKINYAISHRWHLSAGLQAVHFSNGNTSWPNSGVNTVGASISVSYLLSPVVERHSGDASAIEAEADRGRWMYDITAYGAWRKRVVMIGDPEEPHLCPGRFGVAGLQFSPLRRLNRYVAVGPSLDLQWDESAGLAPYWVDGSSDDMIKFHRPPFVKQLSVGVSGHAELIMPIFAVNAGLGYEIVNPKGDKRFYQSLTLKTFITRRVFLNAGYRLGNFKDPQNLMLGVGIRL